MKHLSATDYTVMPWQNGGGVTTEIARDVDNGSYGWRLSIADITADGPFSAFPGMSRIISVLTGNGMVLTVDGTPSRTLARYQAFAFDGAAITSCALIDGPIRDFNVIFNPERYTADVNWYREPVEMPAGSYVVLSAHQGCVVNDRSLAQFDTCFCEDPVHVRPHEGQAFAIVTLRANR